MESANISRPIDTEKHYCKICGSDNHVNRYLKDTKSEFYNSYLCSRHLNQLYKNNTIKLTTSDPNEIIIFDNYALIILRDRKCNVVGKSIIDIDDIDKISKFKWCLRKCDGYVASEISGKKEKLHRYILNIKDSHVFVDHINHNLLDNRKCNLRICNSKLNQKNLKQYKNNKSGYTGICKMHNKWQAYINVNNKRIYIGYYEDIEDAINARKEAEEKYYKEYSFSNSMKIANKAKLKDIDTD